MTWLLTTAALAFVASPAGAELVSSTRVVAYDYEASSGLLRKEVVEPDKSELCLVTEYGYDSFGNVTSKLARNCNGSAGLFPGSGAGVNQEAPAPNVGTPVGLLANFPSRIVEKTDHGTDGRFPVSVKNALNHESRTTHDARFGAVLTQTGPNGLSTKWSYDSFGRRRLEQKPDGTGSMWIHAYCKTAIYPTGTDLSCPTIKGVQAVYSVQVYPLHGVDAEAGTYAGQNGAYVKTYLDAFERPIRVETQGFDGGGNSKLVYVDTTYNAKGLVHEKSDPYHAGGDVAQVRWTTREYDALGREVLVRAPDGGETTTTYDGLTVSVKDPLGRVTKSISDAAGRVVEVIDARNKSLKKTYTAFGAVERSTDSAGNSVVTQYDGRGRAVKVLDPDLGEQTFKYDALGQLKERVDAKAQVFTFTYDLLGRKLTAKDPSSTRYWQYDAYADGAACAKGLGKVCEVANTNGYRAQYSFDTLGRQVSTRTLVGSALYVSSVEYDDRGRVSKSVYPGGEFSVSYVYTQLGYLLGIRNGQDETKVYWRALDMDAQGRYTQHAQGNGVVTLQAHDPDGGYLSRKVAGVNGAIQDHTFWRDKVGNLLARHDGATGVLSRYAYDELNRVMGEEVSGGGLTQPVTVIQHHDDIGNIIYRSDVGVYAYPPSGSNSVRPHAVVGVSGPVNGNTNLQYAYDANGNMLGSATNGVVNRMVGWTADNMVEYVQQSVGGQVRRADFLYGMGEDRVREVYSVNGTPQRQTIYLNPPGGAGLSYEEETNAQLQVKKKYYLSAGGVAVGVVTTQAGTATNTNTRYWHTDDLGSIVAVTDESGAVVERMAYEPFGKRRNANGTADTSGVLVAETTRRGFTQHEMMDGIGLINMNGRIFDPAIGRFMSADYVIEDDFDQQTYNRYSYLQNNPFGGVDPTGHWGIKSITKPISKAVKQVGKAVSNVGKAVADVGNALEDTWKSVYHSSVGRAVITIAVAYYTGGLGVGEFLAAGNSFISAGMANAAVSGFSAGLVGSNGHLKAGIEGAVTAVAFYSVGTVTNGHNPKPSYFGTADHVANVAGHALVGCASSVAKGGACDEGAAAAALSAAVGPKMPKGEMGLAAHAAVGGTASVLGGGKFANGAVTASFGYLYNACGADPRGCMKLGAATGAVVGVGLAAACDAGTAMTCVVANPGIVAGSMTMGSAIGAAADSISTQVEAYVHGNSWLSPRPTTVYQIVYNATDEVYKYGITDNIANPSARYPQSFYVANNVRMEVITSFDSRAPARMLEIGLCLGHAATHGGKIPPGSTKC